MTAGVLFLEDGRRYWWCTVHHHLFLANWKIIQPISAQGGKNKNQQFNFKSTSNRWISKENGLSWSSGTNGLMKKNSFWWFFFQIFFRFCSIFSTGDWCPLSNVEDACSQINCMLSLWIVYNCQICTCQHRKWKDGFFAGLGFGTGEDRLMLFGLLFHVSYRWS